MTRLAACDAATGSEGTASEGTDAAAVATEASAA
jgi:hypothetical protein